MGELQASPRGTRVVLVYPPLVTSNFGNYYPSTAVLAAYLREQGVSVWQTDLNEAFALYLLSDRVLKRMAGGVGAVAPNQPLEQLAAVLLERNRRALFDSRGRHLFRQEPGGPPHLLGLAAQAFAIDRDLSVDPSAALRDAEELYGDFYDAAGFVDALSPTVVLVGVSCASGGQLLPALVLASRIKAEQPRVRVVLGGPVFSLMAGTQIARLFERVAAIDAIVRYDGERPVAELVGQALEGTWNPGVVAGASVRTNGTVEHVPARPGPRLDDLPFAHYGPEIIDALATPTIGILQARGCYWGRCAYCDFVELFRASPGYRTRTAARAVDEVAHQLSLHQPRFIALITESVPPAFAAEFSRRVIERDLRFEWISFGMADPGFSGELLASMAKAGCVELVVGIETMSDRLLEKMNKRARCRDNIEFLRAAKDSGIQLKVNIIPDFPTTTYDEAMFSLEQLAQLEECLDHVGIYPFVPTHSSRIGRSPEEYGLRRAPSHDSHETRHLEFELNRLPVVDPAMNRDQRTSVFAAYRAFAARIRRRSHDEPQAPIGALAVDPNELAWIARGDELYAYNLRTRAVRSLSKTSEVLFDTISRHGPVALADIVRMAESPTAGAQLVDAAIATNLFVHLPAD